MQLNRPFAILLVLGTISSACTHLPEKNVSEKGQEIYSDVSGAASAFDANLLVNSFYELCLDTDLEIAAIKRIAGERGWTRISDSALSGTGRSQWVHSKRLRLEVLDGAEFTNELFICSVSGLSSDFRSVEMETSSIREILKGEWNLSAIEVVETDITSDLPPEFLELYEATGSEFSDANQYKFFMERKESSITAADWKYGYLRLGGEHRLNVSRPKH